MATKKKKTTKVEDSIPEKVALIIPEKFICTCVGQIMIPSGGNFKGRVVSQKYVQSLDMLLLYFENGYIANNKICRLVEEENGEREN